MDTQQSSEPPTEGGSVRAIAFAAKSTADPHGSIEGQLQDARKLAEKQGLVLVSEYHDESASAYHGNRGPNLARAIAEAERLAAEDGRAALIVQHSDRLARGDGRKAKHLVEYALWALKSNITICSVQDPQTFRDDLIYAALTGQRNHEDSARKSSATRDGLRRRKERGEPVGAVPLGYRVIDEVTNGRAVARRVIDPTGSATVERIFDLIETGHTTGHVARTLNAEGRVTQRGKTWSSPAVRRFIENDVYTGTKGYPPLIARDRWERVQEGLTRLDAAGTQRRRGGRPASDSYLLRGVAFCARCGASLYTRHFASGRHYLCGNVRVATGLCDAPRIPAELAESQVMNHLNTFVGPVDSWIAEQLGRRSAEQATREAVLKRERDLLADLDRQREQHFAEYRKMISDGDRLARLALEQVDRLDHDRANQQSAVAEAEAVVAEFEVPVDLDAALDFYNGLVDLVRNRVPTAEGAAELNGVLHQVLAGIWFDLDTERERLLAEFQLRTPPQYRLPGGVPIDPAFDSERMSLPPQSCDARMDPGWELVADKLGV